MYRGIIKKVTMVDGEPMHSFQVGDYVVFYSIDSVPVNDGSGTPIRVHRDTLATLECTDRKQIVPLDDIQILEGGGADR